MIIRAAAILALAGLAASAAERVDLNGDWMFAIDRAQNGVQSGWTKKIPATAEHVNVPHTWNVGKYDDYEGTAWYFRTLSLPPAARGKHVELHFGATFYQARVWINGVEAGSHEGGHTAWWVDATGKLDNESLIAVEIDNRPGLSTIPGYAMSLRGGDNVWYDWWHYGGIVRDVWLTVNEPLLTRRQQVRSKITGTSADVTDRVFLENHGQQPAAARLRIEILPPDGAAPLAIAEQPVTITPGASDVALRLHTDNLRLWHFDHPNVYTVRATLLDGKGVTLDRIDDNYGFRTIEIRDRHLLINGERVRLSGMTRHEESPAEGLAETRGTMLHDYNEMKELQVTLTRPVHYPQHPFIFDFADRNGMLFIPEIPMWQFSEAQMMDPKVIALAQRMMTEMIEQNYNHPSILGWSMCNESETHKPGGRKYFDTMYAMVKTLDPDRYISYADNQIAGGADPKINAASVADFIMINQYAGTWGGPAAGLVPMLEKAGADYPGKMMIISEFGVAGIFAPDKERGDALRRRIMREQLDVFRKYDFIAGAIFWCYQDYKSHRNLRPGERSGMVEMGIVDENRKRYPSFNLWKEQNTPARVTLDFTFQGFAPAGFKAVISRRPEDSLPSYVLRGYRAAWEARDADGNLVAQGDKLIADVGPPQTVQVEWPVVKSKGLSLTFRLTRPTGFTAWERTIDNWQGLSGGDSVEDMRKRGYIVP